MAFFVGFVLNLEVKHKMGKLHLVTCFKYAQTFHKYNTGPPAVYSAFWAIVSGLPGAFYLQLPSYWILK